MDEEYRQELIRDLKECGQDLIDHADALLPRDIQYLSSYEATVKLSIDGSRAPVIEVRTEFYPGTHIERISKEGLYGSRI